MSSLSSHWVVGLGRLFLASILGAAFLAGTARGADSRPNILFIFSDDHAYQAISAYGDARHLVDTPNLDRIAKGGMLFTRCLTTNSLCGPSRATVITGKYSFANGFYNNTNSVFDGTQVTMPKLMQAAGYQTCMLGKWHLVSDPTGFDNYQMLIGQGKYYNPPMKHNGAMVKTSGYISTILTDLSIDWLKKRDPNKPFLLMCCEKATHSEWEPGPDDFDYDHGRVYDEPSTLFDNYDGRGIAEHDQSMEIAKDFGRARAALQAPNDMNPEQLAKWHAYYDPLNAAFKAQHLTGDAATRWYYQRFMHDYTGTVHSLDREVGRLLDYLDASGLSKNTIVVYSSDQGLFLGEHGWFDKRWIFEESLKTPLMIRWPGVTKPGSRSDAIVSNLDYAETFVDVAQAPIPPEMQGRSLVPILKGETPPDWRTGFYYHYYEYPTPHHVRPHYGIVTDRYKLVHFYKDSDYWELFDLQKDPDEMKSVFTDPNYAAVRKELMAQLTKLRADLKVPAKDAPGSSGKVAVPEAPQVPPEDD